ncbi:hypothetical protein P3S67_020719 [Capsicum chacoense]
MRPLLIWEDCEPYLTPTVCEIEQRYMKIFKSYTNEVKDTSIDALKAQLKGVNVLTLLDEVADEDEDLGDHNYVPSIARACDHAGSSGLKTTPDSSNDDDLNERVGLLEKSVLNIASFVRVERLRRIEKNKKKQQDEMRLDSPPHSRKQVNLEELVVVVTDIATANKKVEEEKKEEETQEEKETDEQDVEEKKDEEMTAEKEAKNEKKVKEDGEKNSEEKEEKKEKAVDEEVVAEQEVECIEEKNKPSEEEEEKENDKKEVEEEEKKYEENKVDVMSIVKELSDDNM